MLITVVFREPKFRSMGWFSAQPQSTEKGTTKSEICVEEPTAMPMESPGLSMMANRMAEACSQALPTMGRRMTPTKACGTPQSVTRPSMASTMYSERKATMTVLTQSSATAQGMPSTALSSPSSPSSGEARAQSAMTRAVRSSWPAGTVEFRAEPQSPALVPSRNSVRPLASSLATSLTFSRPFMRKFSLPLSLSLKAMRSPSVSTYSTASSCGSPAGGLSSKNSVCV
mmetsp:Transcript_64342/g.207308  ORF Transcript_64342/g.207308 Transcript_64342/m.207308 type:complete len:228 (+) Transcript_64342:246-929(+)